MLYTMKETCTQVEMNYEALKFTAGKGWFPMLKETRIISAFLTSVTLPGSEAFSACGAAE